MCLVVVTNLDDFKNVSVLSQSRGVEDGTPHPTVHPRPRVAIIQSISSLIQHL